MSKTAIDRPGTEEYAEYYTTYISKVPGSDILGFLEEQLGSTMTLLRGIDESKADFRYEPGKWSIKELVGHIIDSEKVFAYRGLVFARNDSASLPGFDQDVWAKHANYANLLFTEIIAEFEAVRRATILQFRHLPLDAWSRRGIANANQMTARATAYIIAGHAEHHLGILRQRYLRA